MNVYKAEGQVRQFRPVVEVVIKQITQGGCVVFELRGDQTIVAANNSIKRQLIVTVGNNHH